jgi:hypothetical protein
MLLLGSVILREGKCYSTDTVAYVTLVQCYSVFLFSSMSEFWCGVTGMVLENTVVLRWKRQYFLLTFFFVLM